MDLLRRVKHVRHTLADVPGVQIDALESSAPVSDEDVIVLEQRIGHRLPASLRQVYTEQAGSVRFFWTAEPEVFGPTCRYGELALLHPSTILDHAEGLWALAEDARREYNLETEPGWAAIANDWPSWVPICVFGNGDYLCLETRKGNGDYPVVFLVHDIMWDYSGVHGQQLAPTFQELLQRWSQVGFVMRFDWTDGLDQMGIGIDAPVYRRLRECLGGDVAGA